MLPADVLKKVIELLEQLRRADKDHQGGTVFIYAPGSQYVETVQNQYLYPAPRSAEGRLQGKNPAPYRGGESTIGEPAYDRSGESTVGGKPAYNRGGENTMGGKPSNDRGGESLPEVLATDKAMTLWRKAQEAVYVDANYQPLISRTQAALLADAMAERLGIKEKWKVFEGLWHRKYMRSDYNLALTRKRTLDFQDELKQLFD